MYHLLRFVAVSLSVLALSGGRADAEPTGSPPQSGFTSTFDETALGVLPTDVAVVWTDIGANTGFPSLTDMPVHALGTLEDSLDASTGSSDDSAADDRVFAFTHLAGVPRVTVRPSHAEWEFGYVQDSARASVLTPEPSSLVLFVIGGFCLATMTAYRRVAARPKART